MKYTRTYSVCILLGFLLLLISCDDFFVKDISKINIKVQLPANGCELLQNRVSFVWEEEEGVDTYHVVVVTPSFDSIQTYLCDTVLSSNKMKLNLMAGKYQWSIQAENFGYKSLVNYMTFKVNNNEK